MSAQIMISLYGFYTHMYVRDFTKSIFTAHLNCNNKLLHEECEALPPPSPVAHLRSLSLRVQEVRCAELMGNPARALAGHLLPGAAQPGHTSPSLRESTITEATF